MTIDFIYESLPGRVVFAEGASRDALKAEVDRLGFQRIMLIATEREAELARELSAPFAERVVVLYEEVLPHVPSTVARLAQRTASNHNVDGLVSVGGGSTTGTAKIIARETGLPILAVPTTYAGSEMTPVWGMTTDSRKETGRDLRVLPKTVLYDPVLVRTLPRPMAVASALNAMAHCVEALWTEDTNPVTALTAIEGAAALARGMRNSNSDEASADLLYGAYLAGSAFAVAGSGLHHKICHALGGAFDLPHAETHAVVLPHVLAFNAPAIGERAAQLARALGGEEPVSALSDLYSEVNAPSTLQQLGLTRGQLAEAVDIVSAKLPITNPRPITPDKIGSILLAAYGEEA